jgi:CubicO group peptidase (beta-lactamase class C family)
MIDGYFDGLSGNARNEVLNLLAMAHEAMSGGAYPEGLDAALAEFCGMDSAARASALERLRNPAQAALDEVLPILTDEQAETVPDAFPAWAAGIAYAVGIRVRFDGKLYRCVQAHTSQEDWTPDKTPALWTRIGEPGDEWPEWIQPTGAQDAYAAGDRVSHNGAHWTSDVDANVWEPGVYGWTEVA